MEIPQPRSYVDWTVPVDEAGNEIGVCRDETTYAAYISWLADYLYNTNIPIPENQRSLVERYSEKGVEFAVFELSKDLGSTVWDVESLSTTIVDGGDYAAQHEMEKEAFNSLSEDEKSDWGDEYFTTPEDFERFRIETAASQIVPSHICHADIPYRPVLASLFKGVESKDQRIKLLDSFYRNFNDCASK